MVAFTTERGNPNKFGFNLIYINLKYIHLRVRCRVLKKQCVIKRQIRAPQKKTYASKVVYPKCVLKQAVLIYKNRLTGNV